MALHQGAGRECDHIPPWEVAQVRQCAGAIRHELQEDIDTASLRAQKNDPHGFHSNARFYCSLLVGLFCAVILFSFGILVGWNLHG
jgi:hypothetical protein